MSAELKMSENSLFC